MAATMDGTSPESASLSLSLSFPPLDGFGLPAPARAGGDADATPPMPWKKTPDILSSSFAPS